MLDIVPSPHFTILCISWFEQGLSLARFVKPDLQIQHLKTVFIQEQLQHRLHRTQLYLLQPEWEL